MVKVSGNKDDGYGFTCDDPDCAPGFTSAGWPSKAAAESRLSEHTEEHESGKAQPELADSKAAQ